MTFTLFFPLKYRPVLWFKCTCAHLTIVNVHCMHTVENLGFVLRCIRPIINIFVLKNSYIHWSLWIFRWRMLKSSCGYLTENKLEIKPLKKKKKKANFHLPVMSCHPYMSPTNFYFMPTVELCNHQSKYTQALFCSF